MSPAGICSVLQQRSAVGEGWGKIQFYDRVFLVQKMSLQARQESARWRAIRTTAPGNAELEIMGSLVSIDLGLSCSDPINHHGQKNKLQIHEPDMQMVQMDLCRFWAFSEQTMGKPKRALNWRIMRSRFAD